MCCVYKVYSKLNILYNNQFLILSLLLIMNTIKHIDKFASERLKQRRIAIGLSQKELGETLDISAIQIKKYEEGISTIA